MLTDTTLFWSAAALVGLVLGMLVRYGTLLAAGVVLYLIALAGRQFGASASDIGALFGTAVETLPTFWAGVMIGAAPTAILRHLVGRRRSPAGRLATASGPLREHWRRWPDKSSPPTSDDVRAFHDWLRTHHPDLLVSGHTRLGVLELQDIVGLPKAGASRR